MILVDTSIWSESLRRNSGNTVITNHLKRIILSGLAALVGPIRQEILSGVKDRMQFDRLRADLAAFPDVELTTADFETAAAFFNVCRAKGIQGSNTDFLLCSISERLQAPIFTTDNDFLRYARVLDVRLFNIE